MSIAAEGDVVDLGHISRWPGGYAMSLGVPRGANGVVRCCTGHETPEAAKQHGIVRIVEAALATADVDIALWAARAEPVA